MDELLQYLRLIASKINVARDAEGRVTVDGAIWVGEEEGSLAQLHDAADHLAVALLLHREELERG